MHLRIGAKQKQLEMAEPSRVPGNFEFILANIFNDDAYYSDETDCQLQFTVRRTEIRTE